MSTPIRLHVPLCGKSCQNDTQWTQTPLCYSNSWCRFRLSLDLYTWWDPTEPEEVMGNDKGSKAGSCRALVGSQHFGRGVLVPVWASMSRELMPATCAHLSLIRFSNSWFITLTCGRIKGKNEMQNAVTANNFLIPQRVYRFAWGELNLSYVIVN